jgi:hypothetical protein
VTGTGHLCRDGVAATENKNVAGCFSQVESEGHQTVAGAALKAAKDEKGWTDGHEGADEAEKREKKFSVGFLP